MSIKFVREEQVRVYELDRGLARLITLALALDSRKIEVVKIVREMTGFGLCETKRIVDCLEISDYVTVGGTAVVRVARDLPPTTS